MTLRGQKKFTPGTTVFQNLAQRRIDAKKIKGKDYYTDPYINVISGGIGLNRDDVDKPGALQFEAEKGDIMVLASDGFWDIVSEYEVEKICQESTDSQEMERKLFDLAYARNNIFGAFIIQHSETESTSKALITLKEDEDAVLKGGDNITLAVVEINQ